MSHPLLPLLHRVVLHDLDAIAAGRLTAEPSVTLDLLDLSDRLESELADHDRDDFADELRVA